MNKDTWNYFKTLCCFADSAVLSKTQAEKIQAYNARLDLHGFMVNYPTPTEVGVFNKIEDALQKRIREENLQEQRELPNANV